MRPSQRLSRASGATNTASRCLHKLRLSVNQLLRISMFLPLRAQGKQASPVPGPSESLRYSTSRGSPAPLLPQDDEILSTQRTPARIGHSATPAPDGPAHHIQCEVSHAAALGMRRFRAPETPIRVVHPFRGLFTINVFPNPPRLGAA
jgi:hypothetical protein